VVLCTSAVRLELVLWVSALRLELVVLCVSALCLEVVQRPVSALRLELVLLNHSETDLRSNQQEHVQQLRQLNKQHRHVIYRKIRAWMGDGHDAHACRCERPISERRG